MILTKVYVNDVQTYKLKKNINLMLLSITCYLIRLRVFSTLNLPVKVEYFYRYKING